MYRICIYTDAAERRPLLSLNDGGSRARLFIDYSKKKMTEARVLLNILAVFFGMGSWVVTIGIGNQFGLLVHELPESWSLPSYTNISIQCANVSMVLFVILKKTWKRFNPKYYIYTLMTITLIAAVLQSFFYKETVAIDGQTHSAVFFFLLFVLAMYGCSSSVASYPYLNNYKGNYVTSYYVGEGCSHLVPSIISLIQGAGMNSKSIDNGILFPTRYYILILAFLFSLSLIAFVLMNKLEICKENMIILEKNIEIDDADHQFSASTCFQLILISIVGFILYGIIPSIKSYASLPYGNNIYNLSLILGDITVPIVSLLPYFISKPSNIIVIACICTGLASTIYGTIAAAQSPFPLMIDTNAGGFIMVVVWIIAPASFHLVKTIIASRFKEKGGKWMTWYGSTLQIGAASGSIIGFALTSILKVFAESS